MTRSSDSGRPSWRLLPALAMTMLLPSLGTSIANVALPSLEIAFGAAFSDVQWVVLSYLLAVTTLIVGAGRLGDLVGRRKLLLAGIAIFALASAAAALAPNLWILVAARAVQGLGAAIMMALTMALASEVVPKERVGSAMGLLGTVSAVGTAFGPSLGGALLWWAGWPAVFAAMAVAGIVTFGIAMRLLPASPAGEGRAASFDVPGMVLLALTVGAFALATTLNGTHPDLLNLGLAILVVAGLTAFVVVERRVATPLVRIELLLEPALATGLVCLGLVSAIMMATLVVGPFYLSQALGLTPLQTGLVMSIGPGVAAVAGLPSGRLVDAFGSGKTALAGLTGIVLGATLVAILPGYLGTAGYIGGVVVITASYALFQAANNAAAMAGATKERKGVTSALLGLARNLGLITGASAMGAVFAWGSRGMAAFGLPPGRGTGMMLTFAVAAFLATFALVLAILARRRGSHAEEARRV